MRGSPNGKLFPFAVLLDKRASVPRNSTIFCPSTCDGTRCNDTCQTMVRVDPRDRPDFVRSVHHSARNADERAVLGLLPVTRKVRYHSLNGISL